MKAVLIGLGRYGYGWYQRLKERDLLAAVVDVNDHAKEKMAGDSIPLYRTLEEALAKEQIDFVVNVTPPMVHTSINHQAIDYKLPILCEKPIAFHYQEAVEVIQRAEAEGVPFMVAENYRRTQSVRKLRSLIDEGIIGDISVIDITFYRYHERPRPYPVNLLRDIGVHHFDMLRYLSGVEVERLQANLYQPTGGWDEPGAIMNANIFFELEQGIRASYTASIASRGQATTWQGNWRVEGSEGTLELIGNDIMVYRGDENNRISGDSNVHGTDILHDFLTGLKHHQDFETSGKEYLKAEELVYLAELSSDSRKMIELSRSYSKV